ncbi:MAG TPA: MgtC/SapB family protein [Lacipirellula sp.]
MTVGQEILDSIASEFSDLGDAGTAASVCVRMVLAAALGGALGYERESRGKSAGVRTHMLVALGAALFVMGPSHRGLEGDPLSRVIQGIVAGIGFLGAGAIVKGKPGEDIFGLTTAASIWMTAAIGVTVGTGRGATAILSGVLALIVLAVMDNAFLWIHPNGHNKEEAAGDDGAEP